VDFVQGVDIESSIACEFLVYEWERGEQGVKRTGDVAEGAEEGWEEKEEEGEEDEGSEDGWGKRERGEEHG
jgi:hypothetical protein